MKTTAICALLSIISLAASAQEQRKKLTRDEYDKLSPEQKRILHEAAAQRRYQRTGGFILKPGSLQGEIYYVNCQERADAKWLSESINYFKKQTSLDIKLSDGKFRFPSPEVKGALSLFVVDDKSYPSILIAPEDRWAMVNIAPLEIGAKPVFFEARVKKQLSRVFSALCGATNSQFPMSLTGGITSANELDKYPDYELPVDVISRFPSYLAAFGVSPATYFTYQQGCLEGWAPAPTNDVQRAIWEKIKAEKSEKPTNPIKVTYDPKTAPKVEK